MALVDTNLGSGPVVVMSFDELFSRGAGSLKDKYIRVNFPGRLNDEYKIVANQLRRHGYESAGAEEMFCLGGISSAVFVKEDRASARKRDIENAIRFLEKELSVLENGFGD